MIYTNKQRELMRLWQKDELRRINLLEGSVSSGKTWISLVLWAFWVATMPDDKLYLMSGKSITTLKRNCLLPLEGLVGKNNFEFSTSAKEGYLFGRRMLLEGANDMRSESKIRGLTLQGAYADELTQFPEDFFVMLLSRLRVPNAKLIATTNPDNPNHWLKKKYIDRKNDLDFLDVKFLIGDNTTLDPAYVENVKKEYTGVFYDRFILGRWKTAEGAIYRQFADNTEAYILDEPPDDIVFCTIGMDFGGNSSAHAIVLTGYSRGLKKLVALDELYYKGIITPTKLEDLTMDFILNAKQKYNVADMYCDSAEQVLIKGLKEAATRKHVPINIHNARKGEVNDRIKFFLRMMAQHRFYVCRSCPRLIEALQTAVWKDNTNTDVRLDDGTTNIDSLDALEYSAERYMNDMINTGGK